MGQKDNMTRFYLAPMEGITGYVYRNAYAKYYGNIDKYFTPFISPGEHKCYKSRELRDVLPENNTGLNVTVQMLTNNADHFLHTTKKLKEFGYKEVNLNLGCPSGTVVSKGRGSGFLAYPDRLDDFLDTVFEGVDKIGIALSVKTRLGRDDENEFYNLLEIYNKYPLSELIIHPRIQKDMYKNSPRMDLFRYALEHSVNPVVYNGDIFNAWRYNEFVGDFPQVDTVMLGRGIIINPGLMDYITTGKSPDRKKLADFYNELVSNYLEEIQGEKNVMFKMKELMFYLVNIFVERDVYWKKFKKADNLSELVYILQNMIADGKMIPDKDFIPLFF